MANRLRSTWLARATVVAAVFALPLLGAGVAQAAIAGAPHEQTSNRPDLVSATILTAVPGAVDFCFDKTLTSVDHPFHSDAFQLAGYRSHNSLDSDAYALETTLPPPAGLPPQSCVRAYFQSTGADLAAYTIGFVERGSVAWNGGAPGIPVSPDGNNLSDSTPLTGSDTHNGTSGFTAAPDLQAALVDSTSNSITYVMDQAVGNAPVARNFHFVDGAGNVCFGTNVLAAGDNSVTVSFAFDGCVFGFNESVNNAVRAGDEQGAVTAANDQTTVNVDQQVAVTGTSGQTSRPDLISVQQESDKSALDFTFNKNVVPVDPGDFYADLSNGSMIHGNNATPVAQSTNSTTIRVTFQNYSTYSEYVVGGSVEGVERGLNNGNFIACAVRISAITSACNTPGWAPIGPPAGNIGSFARGFTTGPDVLFALGNTTTNVVQVALDQRAFFSNPRDIALLDSTGNVIDTAGPTSVNLPTQTPGRQTAVVTFASGQVQQAKNLALEDFPFFPINFPDTGSVINWAFSSNLGTGSDGSCTLQHCHNQPSVAQILSITTTASLVKAAKHAKPQSKAWAARVTRARKAAASKKAAKLVKRHHRRHRHHRR